jgi:hypothetical protein
MRISLLLRREPFGGILEKSLSRYLQARYAKPFVVKWHTRRPTRSSSAGKQLWLCNPYLNILFIPGVQEDVTSPVVQEYSRSLNPWVRPFQRLYVGLALRRHTCRFLTRGAISISPVLPHAERLIFLGGNHHFRMLDGSAKQAVVIQKSGFNTALMRSDIEIRKAHPYLPSPRIHEIAEDVSWYAEDLISGTPLNRLKSTNEAEEAMEKVLPLLYRLYKETARTMKALDYAEEVAARMAPRKEALAQLDRQTAYQIWEMADHLRKRISKDKDMEVTIVQSHGDFQPANILKEGELVWLIDWEYTRPRQAAYDGLVYSLQSRFPKDLGKRVITALSDIDSAPLEGIQDNPFVDWEDSARRRMILALFLLEELELKVMENANPLFFRLDTGITVLVKEIREALPAVLRQ